MPEQHKRTTYGKNGTQRKRGSSRPDSTTRRAPASRTAPSAAEAATRHLSALRIAIIAVVAVIAFFFLRMCAAAMTIDITVNDNPCTIHGSKTLQTAIKESGLPINPGDLISIRGVVLRKSAGEPFTATVNGETVSDPDFQLHDGDKLTIADGKDVVEEYESSEELTPHAAYITGAGAIHLFTAGSDGVTEVRTGKVSGEVVERQRSEASDSACVKYNPEVGDDKVIALTFDEGPTEEYTADILDILKDNDAKATFFCVGTQIEKYNDSLVKRERDEGHQVCTGTYDHARSTNDKSAASLDEEDLVNQVEHGRELITAALGDEEASRIVRLPGGELNEDMVRALDSYVDAEIGWNVDTGDWTESDKDDIYHVLTSLENGDIVLCHDGGGDHSATVEALREAVPKLREEGYSFVTINDLMEYPAQ